MSDIETIETVLKEKTVEKIQNMKTHVFEELKKAKVDMNNKVVAGVAVTATITENVHEANRRALEVVDVSNNTAYTNFIESVEKVSYNWMSFNYNEDKVIVDEIDKVKDTLKQAYERKANIREALKDIGRAFKGQERLNNDGVLTNVQKELIAKLDSLSGKLKHEMELLKGEVTLI